MITADDAIAQLLENYLADNDLKKAILAFHAENIEAIQYFPASARHHHCYPGGYHDHILEVMNNVMTIFPICVLDAEAFDLSDALTAAYLHDLDKATSLVKGESHRYELDEEPPTQKQVDYAIGLGVQVSTAFESKTSISFKIQSAIDGQRYDEFKVPYFKHRQSSTLPIDDGAIVTSICAHNGILLKMSVLSAICCHHGGFAPIIKENKHHNMTALAVLVHTADYISSACQGGKSLGR